MKEIQTEIEIEASAERVWQVLTDFAAYPQWNPFVRQAIGIPKTGERLRVHLGPSGTRGMTFTPTLLSVQPNQELRWLGRLFVPGLFDGEHSFRIEPLAENRVRFVQSERFRGLLVPFLAHSLDTDTRRGFEEMNQALKQRVEGAPTTKTT